MRLLADTQAFLWHMSGDGRLSQHAREALEAPDSEWFLSVASVWEMAIKAGTARLTLPAPTAVYVAEKVKVGLKILPVDWTHAAAVDGLPLHHRDPFDRVLIAQAQAERLTIVTSDSMFERYGVAVIW